ncbi:(d)CMP kinase [Sutcliffiella horikoshii]|uniref:(d)CMP kinase n=1 Tax=Sutcliffiella horikoshii TaxID=79883 RepID=UPI0007D04EBD|nr:(d)CMP kinase [Sutcliffiella horikoshii]MCM3617392.1 (d)CMP kinase [Sutcliffiella horikoshii]
MKQQKLSVAIDGPAAAGKSTVAKIVADKLGYLYIDTGAMYRAITFQAIRHDVNLEDEKSLQELVEKMEIDLRATNNKTQHVYINDEDVTEQIRTHDVTNNVSIVAKHKSVREEMVARQQILAKRGGVVMDGRDIGTHVLPDAEVKVFLLASVEERAHRRHAENLSKGFESDLEKLKLEIARRDKLDSEREIAPLQKAHDAKEIDTTSLSIDQVVGKIMELVLLQSERAGRP